jgi:hypothetical protein
MIKNGFLVFRGIKTIKVRFVVGTKTGFEFEGKERTNAIPLCFWNDNCF